MQHVCREVDVIMLMLHVDVAHVNVKTDSSWHMAAVVSMSSMEKGHYKMESYT